MRTRLTKKPWFGPKRQVGWGWSVTSWEGRLAAAVFFVLAIAAALTLHGSARVASLVGLLVVFGVVVLLTGDPPGGPGYG